MLSDNDKKKILNRFPTVELSYDKILHKKVYADLFMIQPKGIPSFLWFTYYGNRNICIVLQLNRKGNVKQLNVFPVCFERELSYGTLLYGTYFLVGNQNYFSCEDIFVYQGNNVHSYSLTRKMYYIKRIFTEFILQKAYNKTFLLVGLPVWCHNYNDALSKAKTLPYSVYGIKSFNTKLSGNETLGIHIYHRTLNVEGVFLVQPTLKDDIYNIFCRGSNCKYGTACVPSFRRSAQLNSLFRKVKENDNLDLLEESDDEEEFENVCEDKYVYLHKKLVMKCVYHKRFKKWEPIEVINDVTQKLTTNAEARTYEKKV